MDTLKNYLVELAQNNRWSNHRLHNACSKLSETEYFAQRKSFFGSIHATLNHILIVDLLYLGRVREETLVNCNVDEYCNNFADLAQEQSTVDQQIVSFCESLTADSLDKRVQFKISNGDTYSERIQAVLTHLFFHQTHHRGQVHDMLCGTSVTPPQLDEYFLDGDLPLRRDELKTLKMTGL